MASMRLALTVMIGAALFGVAAGFQPVLPATRGAAARSGRSRAAPHASCVAARRACSSARVYGAAQLVRMRAHAHEAPSAPVRGISGSPATPWARLKQVAFGLLAALSLMAALMFSCPARAAVAVHRASALPPIHSQVMEVVNVDMKDTITSRKGLRLVMAAASKDKTAPVDAASVMVSMHTLEQKQRLTMMVSAAYVAVWAFFYFTHDGGEVSE